MQAECSECQVRSTYTPVEGNGLPLGWIHFGKDRLLCLSCRRRRAGTKGTGRDSLLRWELRRDPHRADVIIAATLTSSGSRNWKLVAEIRRLRKEMDLPRIPSPKKPPASPAPKPEKKASPRPRARPGPLAGQTPARDVAKEWLLDVLSDGEPHLSHEVHAAAEKAGLSVRTVDRAALQLPPERRGAKGTRTWLLKPDTAKP